MLTATQQIMLVGSRSSIGLARLGKLCSTPRCGKKAFSMSPQHPTKPFKSNLSGGGGGAKRVQATVASSSSAEYAAVSVDRPTKQQLWRVFCHAAVPMIGFGFTDQTIMILAGNAIDCTLGVTFGLSTMTAAAFGQICSNASGVVFGGTLERIAKAVGLPSANLTSAQRSLAIVGRTRWAGNFFGVILGCCLGLINLLFIDSGRSSALKLQAVNEEQEFDFEIEASNAAGNSSTVLTVRGPDVDGLLASMTAALAVRGCSIVEIHAKRENDKGDLTADDRLITDVFHVVNRNTGLPFEDDELEELAQGLLDSTRTPMNVNTVVAAMHELESTNSYLQARIKKLEHTMKKKQISLD